MADGRFTFVIEDCAILQADGWEGNLPAFEASLTEQLACNLPAGVGAAVRAGERWVTRIAPRRFWLIGDGRDDFPLSFAPELGSVVSLSEGRLRLRMTGSRLFDVLASCVAIDWFSPRAATGSAVQTGFHHVPVFILRTGDTQCDMIVPRSFARSLSDWMTDIAASLDLPANAVEMDRTG